jgi:hypothetical protein
MKVGLLVAPAGGRLWHHWLAADLVAAGHDVVALVPGAKVRGYGRWPPGLRLTLFLDALMHRTEGGHALDPVPVEALVPGRQGATEARLDADAPAFDIVVHCVSGLSCDNTIAPRILSLRFDGVDSEVGAITALIDQRLPLLTLEDSRLLGACERITPAVASCVCLSEALDNVFSCAVELLVARINHQGSPVAKAAPRDASDLSSNGRPNDGWNMSAAMMRRLTKQFSGKIARVASRRTQPRQKWALALRACAPPGLIGGEWPARARYTLVPDDGQRFYADPFLFKHADRIHLFCEEFPFSTERGIISVAEVDGSGRIGALRPVLERPYHLSYPFLFAFQGQIWMLPEASESGAIEIYRAIEYPTRWRLERRLLEGLAALDATLLEHDGAFWLFLTSQQRQGTGWDNLRVYRAQTPLGPWSECCGGLVTIDPNLSRPAGACIRRGDSVLRLSQQCQRIYGGGIIVSRIDRLDGDGMVQTPVAEIVAEEPDGITGAHTYSRIGNIEAVDVWGRIDGKREVQLACRPLGGSRRLQSTSIVGGRTGD